jgi:hypothetical protein
MFFVHQQKKTGICFDVAGVVLLFWSRKHIVKNAENQQYKRMA